MGLRIFYIRLPSTLAGIFAYTEDLGGCIAVNVRHPEERRRWSMAHEYGHFLTSRFRPELTALRQSGRVSASERFADAFAAALLMPVPRAETKVLPDFPRCRRCGNCRRNLPASALLLRVRGGYVPALGGTAAGSRRDLGTVARPWIQGSRSTAAAWDCTPHPAR